MKREQSSLDLRELKVKMNTKSNGYYQDEGVEKMMVKRVASLK
jgi:hypothetical protein